MCEKTKNKQKNIKKQKREVIWNDITKETKLKESGEEENNRKIENNMKKKGRLELFLEGKKKKNEKQTNEELKSGNKKCQR